MSRSLKPPFERISNAPLPSEADPLLRQYADVLEARRVRADEAERRIEKEYGSLEAFAGAYDFFGLHKEKDSWVFREYAPNAESIVLAGDFSNWRNDDVFRLKPCGHGIWE